MGWELPSTPRDSTAQVPDLQRKSLPFFPILPASSHEGWHRATTSSGFPSGGGRRGVRRTALSGFATHRTHHPISPEKRRAYWGVGGKREVLTAGLRNACQALGVLCSADSPAPGPLQRFCRDDSPRSAAGHTHPMGSPGTKPTRGAQWGLVPGRALMDPWRGAGWGGLPEPWRSPEPWRLPSQLTAPQTMRTPPTPLPVCTPALIGRG
ncbi:uncharacterized protein LOC119540853 [Choloepus didactylus]|uniref:uncharacterized protein LOC119540853 n=1 Tax=Choloepus didactylus TaxID=27675 RepID=UPI00189D3F96|nr:uncharacterized protein LOC119540853 [Choloepus didactylus]